MSDKPVFVFTSKYLGSEADDLGDILIRGLFRNLTKVDPKPQVLIFLNSSVELLISPEIQENLDILEKQGTKILVCGTCVDYFELRDQIRSDRLSNMGKILTTISNASKVINF
ncbi:MAG: DsrE family protein [Halanaerobiales bacterium]|nr:DsrE family protein [Halanaerobiales bacterium]